MMVTAEFPIKTDTGTHLLGHRLLMHKDDPFQYVWPLAIQKMTDSFIKAIHS